MPAKKTPPAKKRTTAPRRASATKKKPAKNTPKTTRRPSKTVPRASKKRSAKVVEEAHTHSAPAPVRKTRTVNRKKLELVTKPVFHALGRAIDRAPSVEFKRPSPCKVQQYLAHRLNHNDYGGNACSAADISTTNYEPVQFDPQVLRTIVDSCAHDIVAVPLGLHFTVGQSAKSSDASHANMIIIDKRKSPLEIERFEPHGSYERLFYDGARIDRLVEEAMQETFGTDINYVPINVGFPGKGLQVRHRNDGGLCACWSVFYAEIRVQHPDMSRDQIRSYMDGLSRDEVHSVIQDFLYAVEHDFPTDPTTSPGIWKMSIFSWLNIRAKIDGRSKPGTNHVLKELVEKVERCNDAKKLVEFDKSIGHYSTIEDALVGFDTGKSAETLVADKIAKIQAELAQYSQ